MIIAQIIERSRVMKRIVFPIRLAGNFNAVITGDAHLLVIGVDLVRIAFVQTRIVELRDEQDDGGDLSSRLSRDESHPHGQFTTGGGHQRRRNASDEHGERRPDGQRRPDLQDEARVDVRLRKPLQENDARWNDGEAPHGDGQIGVDDDEHEHVRRTNGEVHIAWTDVNDKETIDGGDRAAEVQSQGCLNGRTEGTFDGNDETHTEQQLTFDAEGGSRSECERCHALSSEMSSDDGVEVELTEMPISVRKATINRAENAGRMGCQHVHRGARGVPDLGMKMLFVI